MSVNCTFLPYPAGRGKMMSLRATAKQSSLLPPFVREVARMRRRVFYPLLPPHLIPAPSPLPSPVGRG